MKKEKFNLRPLNIQRITGLAVVLIIAAVGVHLLLAVRAESPFGSSQAASGALTGQATKQEDSDGSSDVQFGYSLSSGLAAHVENGQLVNGQGKPFRLLGVDVSGTEDACILNDGLSWGASNTVAEDTASAAALLTWHVNTVRVPLNEDCWLGINGSPAAYSGSNYQTAIENWVTALNKAGIIAILDLHWAAPSTYAPTEQWPMVDEDHTPTFWSQVAADFKTDPGVIYDLFNEPKLDSSHPTAADWTCWLKGCSISFAPTVYGVAEPAVTYTTAGMQQLVDVVRATGANQPIMLGGLNWAGDPCGQDDVGGNGGVCAEVANMPTDPDNQLAISFHTYSWTACTSTTCWNTVSQAAKAAKLPLITGEIGEDDCSDNYINTYMNWADQNDVSYLVWSWEKDYNTSTSCTPPSYDLQLLTNYSGTPSPYNPEAQDVMTHLLTISP